ncbi:MAG: radical SAM protein [Elusimicrobia bacterium]|nr:radical SAM protein [Elusimicrobiota bacterium]
MSKERGADVGDYSAPLFLAWQLTNRCQARCLHCCEESGPDKAWKDELTREESLKLARDAVAAGIPYAAFGGGEPLGVKHVWEVLKVLVEGGTELKLETNGLPIGEREADLLAEWKAQCIQISMDGATKEVHETVRPGGDFDGALASIKRLVKRGLSPEFVFVPNKRNAHQAAAAYELAAQLGCRTFVTGPMMRLGRAAQSWNGLSLADREWADAEAVMRQKAAQLGEPVKLSVYPWDILTEMRTRLESPQAMMLVVPNGRAKLLNALPFAPGDLRRHSLAECWEFYKEAWRSEEVADFIERAQTDSSLLRYANDTWDTGEWTLRRKALASR